MDRLISLKDSLLSLSLLVIGLYLIAGAINRLYFSPIAKFPGPKLAALTYWYEFYYNIILRGRYTFKLREIHAKYGPIVRINPYELHISDPDFYEILYAGPGKRRDRWPWHAKGLLIDNSSLGTVDHDLHRKRRTALSGFFSTQSVRKLQPVIQERVDTLVERLSALRDSGHIVPMQYAYSAFSNDVVMEYCFGRTDHRLEAEGFDPSFHERSHRAGNLHPFMCHLNWIGQIIKRLPDSWAMQMGPDLSAAIILKRERMEQIDEIRNDSRKRQDDSTHRTILHELLASSLPESEKSTPRLAEEAVLLVGAGTETTAWALSVATYHLLAEPATLCALKIELEAAIADPTENTDLADLEKLPYLTAVIKEGLRLSYGTSSRLPRVSPDAPLQFNDWVIPAGTPVSLTSTIIHHDESIFPDSHAFKPERWINDPTGHLDRYMVSFSKGTRACAGQNLGWAELYMCLAGIFRRFGTKEARGKDDVAVLELYETDVSDVEIVGDRFFAMVKEGSKGIRVKVLS